MRRPTGEWVTELARESGFQNGPALPAGAQDGITLQMVGVDGRLRGRYSLDDGATWTEIGAGFALAGLSAPGIGLSAYNGTGAEIGSFDYFHVGEPDLPPPPPCDEPYTPEAGYTMLFDGTDSSLADWAYAGGGSFVREDCTIKSVGAFGLLYTKQDHEAPYSLKLEWMMPGDDNSGVFVGFPDTGANTDQTSISQGEEIQIDATDNPAQTTGAIYLEQARGHRSPRRRRSTRRVSGTSTSSSSGTTASSSSSTARRSTSGSTTTRTSISPRATSACRRTAPATTSTSATCGSRTSPRSRCATRRRRRPPIPHRSRSAAAAT